MIDMDLMRQVRKLWRLAEAYAEDGGLYTAADRMQEATDLVRQAAVKRSAALDALIASGRAR